MGPPQPPDAILQGLNPAQRTAVTTPASVVQILAPPGSGKTKTLTARVAHLLSHNGYRPQNVIVATFTVKAAREMKERLGSLIGNGLEAKLVLGTFHSISRRYLVRYGHLIGIRRGFGIADSSDSLTLIKRIIKQRFLQVDPGKARNTISSSKAKGISQAEFAATAHAKPTFDNRGIATVYEEYQAALARSNTLDYDDLLLRAIDLLREHPACVSNVEAVLIDEFQDTNLVQFDLMRLFAAHRKQVTVVGDPDQSIYSFRSAEIKNLKRMQVQYPDTLVVLLEENYRSAGAILLSALAVIEQDKSRPVKALLPTHCVGTPPVLRMLSSPGTEAQWIVSEIQRSIAMLGGDLLSFDDYAILIRSAFLSRHVESALGRSGIPYRVCGGSRFYDRAEVKIILDYLRVISSTDNNEAFARIINVPPRRIGEKSVQHLVESAEAKKMSLHDLAQAVAHGKQIRDVKVPKTANQGLNSLISLITAARAKMFDSAGPPFSLRDLMLHLTKELSFQAYLEKTHVDDHETRWANVEELVAQAAETSTGDCEEVEDEESLPIIAGVEQETPTGSEDALSRFLANVALSSEVKQDNDTDGTPKAQVTISTIHAAKGLEWPVVFIPAAYEGSIPHSRAEDTDEERRLLYVAMTRAKVLLYMSVPGYNSQGEHSYPSRFLDCNTVKPHVREVGPSLSHTVTKDIARMLRRDCPSEAQIHQSSKDLPSREDDLWDAKGKLNRDVPGRVRLGHDDNPPDSKRRRVGPDEHAAPSRSQRWAYPGQYSSATTMQNPTAFSVAATTMNAGFVTAGSHLRDLDRQRLATQNPGKENRHPAAQVTRPAVRPAVGGEKAKKAPKAPASRIGAGQSGSWDFKRDSLPGLHAGQGAAGPRAPGTSWDTTIPVDLSNHRPRVTTGTPNVQREAAGDDKPYAFLSSSPRGEARQAQPRNAPAKTAETKACLALDAACRGSGLPAPVKPPSKKTLGVRRSMNGWPARRD